MWEFSSNGTKNIKSKYGSKRELVLSILANPFGIHNNYKNDILVIYSPNMLQLHYYLLGLCNNNDDDKINTYR